MKGRCADENHARTRKTRFLYDWLSSYVFFDSGIRNRVFVLQTQIMAP